VKPLTSAAIILRRTNYGEADRILQLLTPDHGVVSTIAKGVRREKSKLAGGLELLAICDVTIIRGRGDLGIVSSARLRQFYGHILRDYTRLQFAYEAIRRVAGAAEMVPEPEFYALLARIFASLDDLTIDVRLSEIWFRLNLARLLGRGLNVRYDVAGQKLAAHSKYNFDIGEMSFVPAPNGRFDGETIKFLRIASAKPPETLRQIGGLDDVLESALWLARVVSE